MNIQELYDWIEAYESQNGNIPKYIGMPYDWIRAYLSHCIDNREFVNRMSVSGTDFIGVHLPIYNTILIGGRKFRKFTPLKLTLVEIA